MGRMPSKKSKDPKKPIKARRASTDDWTLERFMRELDRTMKRQELENPRLVRVHEKLSPEFRKISELIFRFADARDEETEEETIDKILECREKALVPLIEFIRSIKMLQK